MTVDRATDAGPCPFTSDMLDEPEEPTELGKLVPIGMTVVIFCFCYFHLFYHA